MTQNFTDVVILAGGFGERLWPASSPLFPKQFLSLQDGTSFLVSSLSRALNIKPEGKILIISRPEICDTLTKQVMEFAEKSSQEKKEKIYKDTIVIAEPCSRHTCAPLLLACKYLEKLDEKKHNVLVLASDHVISTDEQFISDCKKAAEASSKGNFVCFAINPTEPSTGYGYINAGEKISEDVYVISSFKEKPDAETAKKYLESGKYFWNSGMFGFTTDFFQNELSLFENEMVEEFKKFDSAALPEDKKLNDIFYIENWDTLNSVYSNIKSIAVDNAVAERTKKAVVVKASFTWDDVGSWDAFEKLFKEPAENEVSTQSENNFVYSDLPVALCGVKDLVVVVKNGKVLVMKKGQSNNMRELVKKIKEAETK